MKALRKKYVKGDVSIRDSSNKKSESKRTGVTLPHGTTAGLKDWFL